MGFLPLLPLLLALTGCATSARSRSELAPARAAASSEQLSASIAADNLLIDAGEREVVIEIDLENRGTHPVVVSRKGFRVVDRAGNTAYLEQEGEAFADSTTGKALRVGLTPVAVVAGVAMAPIAIPVTGVVRAARTLSPSPTEQDRVDEATRSFRWKDFILQPGIRATVFLVFDAEHLDVAGPLTLRIEGAGPTLEMPLGQ